MYKFPEIRTIDDVLPAIEGRDEFIVADKGDYKVLNYIVAFPASFDDTEEGWELRRECRGLIFAPSGEIISRPFHKFFNVNERTETHESVLPITTDHHLMEKMDGSMIRPFVVNGKMRLGTKMGVTDIANDAEEWMLGQDPIYRKWMEDMIYLGYTPLFEWIGPDNRIVLKYDKPDLVLLNLRDNVSGQYLGTYMAPDEITKVPTYTGLTESVKDYIARARKDVDREGNVMIWPRTGQMVKFKNDWYVQIHRVKDEVQNWRHVARKMYENTLDDVLPVLDEEDREHLLRFVDDFSNAEKEMVSDIREICNNVQFRFGTDKKRIALEFVKDLDSDHKWLSRYLFAHADGKDIAELVRENILTSTSSNTKMNACLEWLFLKGYTQ